MTAREKVFNRLHRIACYEPFPCTLKIHRLEIRDMIESGEGSVSVDRYLRFLRSEGILSYVINKGWYSITLLKPFKAKVSHAGLDCGHSGSVLPKIEPVRFDNQGQGLFFNEKVK